MTQLHQWTTASLTLLLFTLTLHSATVQAADTEPQRYIAEPQRHIEVNGHGQIHAAPDMALLTLTFSKLDAQPAHAKTIVDAQTTDLLALSQRLKIEDKDIQAAKLTIYPEYDHSKNRKLLGYRVNRDVRIKIRDLLNYPKLLEGAVNIGATHTGQLQLDFSDRKTLENQALQAAFHDAKQQAELLAQAAGGTVGEALWIHAPANYSPGPMRMSMVAQSEAGGSYPTGEMQLSRQLQVRFALQN